MVCPITSCLLAVVVALATTLPTPGYREEANLLTSIDLGHLTSRFEAAELEIEHMADLDITELTSLGNHYKNHLKKNMTSSVSLTSHQTNTNSATDVQFSFFFFFFQTIRLFLIADIPHCFNLLGTYLFIKSFTRGPEH